MRRLQGTKERRHQVRKRRSPHFLEETKEQSKEQGPGIHDCCTARPSAVLVQRLSLFLWEDPVNRVSVHQLQIETERQTIRQWQDFEVNMLPGHWQDLQRIENWSNHRENVQSSWHKVHTGIYIVKYIYFRLCRKLVDSEEFSPEAISELGLWRSTDSHRHYYRISTTIRHKSANVIAAVFD